MRPIERLNRVLSVGDVSDDAEDVVALTANESRLEVANLAGWNGHLVLDENGLLTRGRPVLARQRTSRRAREGESPSCSYRGTRRATRGERSDPSRCSRDRLRRAFARKPCRIGNCAQNGLVARFGRASRRARLARSAAISAACAATRSATPRRDTRCQSEASIALRVIHPPSSPARRMLPAPAPGNGAPNADGAPDQHSAYSTACAHSHFEEAASAKRTSSQCLAPFGHKCRESFLLA